MFRKPQRTKHNLGKQNPSKGKCLSCLKPRYPAKQCTEFASTLWCRCWVPDLTDWLVVGSPTIEPEIALAREPSQIFHEIRLQFQVISQKTKGADCFWDGFFSPRIFLDYVFFVFRPASKMSYFTAFSRELTHFTLARQLPQHRLQHPPHVRPTSLASPTNRG